MKNGIVSAVLLFALVTPVWADPAPWYVWRSVSSNSTVCAQTSPGAGWVRDTGPYKDLRCTIRAQRVPAIDRKVTPRQQGSSQQ